ncbi:MAG: hypothetical protein IPP40_12790 [bacterium]|nr:hypothetical protein [bacterium]
MKTMIMICFAVIAVTTVMFAEETPPIADFFFASGYLSAEGLDKGTPLPDGTEVKVYWDWDENGPDAKDPNPLLAKNMATRILVHSRLTAQILVLHQGSS